MQFIGKLINQTRENGLSLARFVPDLVPSIFLWGLPLIDVIYHCIQFQEKLMNKNLKV